MKTRLIACSFITIFFISCEKESNNNSYGKNGTNTEALIQALNQELNPLSQDPLVWSDYELQFLDAIADKPIIGLGEATHGTSEFFKAKHRIFKYLVEKHNYKIFEFEADFGESMLINEAIQKSDSSQIENLIKATMLLWPWKTEEVKNMLIWMCKYNVGKSENEKLQFVGIDCQSNNYNPGLLEDYFTLTNATFISYAKSILNTPESTGNSTKHTDYLISLDNLLDTMVLYKPQLIAASSEKKYLLYERVLKVIRQVSMVTYFVSTNDNSYRDKYMAENAVWMLDFFDNKKIVIWAHNGHILNGYLYGVKNMGNYLTQNLSTNYVPIGFLFSKGYFNAYSYLYNGVTKHEINSDPKENLIHYIMCRSKASVFSVNIADLQKYSEWNNTFFRGIQYFHIGGSYNFNLEDYYMPYSPNLFNYLIYFDNTTASILL